MCSSDLSGAQSGIAPHLSTPVAEPAPSADISTGAGISGAAGCVGPNGAVTGLVSGASGPSRPGSAERPPHQATAAAAPPHASSASSPGSVAQPLLGMSLAQLQDWCRSQGQPAFRAKQLHEWIYARGARSLEAITVLPKAWRQQLAASSPMAPVAGVSEAVASEIGRAHV